MSYTFESLPGNARISELKTTGQNLHPGPHGFTKQFAIARVSTVARREVLHVRTAEARHQNSSCLGQNSH